MNSKSEIEFLEGPHSRIKEFIFVIRTMVDLVRGFRGLHFVGPCITFFGSARFSQDHPYYQFARKAASVFAKLGFTIMTGGGPGLMEAANRGAKDVAGRSVGCNISLSREQKPNIYLDRWVNMNHFFTRKVLLVKYSFAFVVLPGGYGTLDECFEALTLIQTRKIHDFPVIIFGKEFHKNLLRHIAEMRENRTISEADFNLLLITDDISQAEEFIKLHSIKKFGLQKVKKHRPLSWLFERQ
ncbi:TIGR00730 family Rossman fold protein [Pedobacter sp. G11]|uniref:LOG family protein n=1 Tax=Pedobacter sp. G11 TaxID=2482728 RepID=UPI000F5EFBDA|nr:TIGR00730 family Rossman fold protein [Pedobacter sp. G11]AZI26742.1 TIGR00730 family Rossman fold protein [Pedobacter sp. G11]